MGRYAPLPYYLYIFIYIINSLPFLTIIPILSLFQGEICVAGSRVFIQEGIYDSFVKKLVEKAEKWVVGDPFDPNVQQGPQV